MMLDQINRRLAEKLAAKTGKPVPAAKPPTHLPRHAVRPPPPRVQTVQTPIVIDGKQVGIAHGDKPMSKKSQAALTSIVKHVHAKMVAGELKPHPVPKEKTVTKKKPPMVVVRQDIPGSKTIGVKVPPDLYAHLEKIKAQRGLKTIKDAMLLAAMRGVLEIDLDPNEARP